MNQTDTILEFNQIREMLCEYAASDAARAALCTLTPSLSERDCRRRMQETTEARRILDSAGSPPQVAMKEMETVLALCGKGAMLSPEQLEGVSRFLSAGKRMKQYLSRAECLQTELATYGQSIDDLSDLQGEIQGAIQNGAVLSAASPALRDLRRKIDQQGAQIKKKLDDLLRGRKQMFAEGYVSQRNGRWVLPVRKEFKNQVAGTVVDMSGTGGTYFIEPASVSRLQEELGTLFIEEDGEIRKILYTLTALVDEYSPTIRINVEALVTLDMAFAKAKLSAAMNAVPVRVDTERTIEIRRGRHPLLHRDNCVPLDFTIGGKTRGVVITGPNTGGKTVALKTVGLLSMMAQSGLHVPVEEGKFCMQNLVLCDIGDGQSITENLSTFSAHITNIIEILSRTTPESLVLLDELGSGTDPAEGMGIAVSILEELRGKGCLFLCTTHYPEVKDYAARAEGLMNARMAFDRESLRPLYRLELGEMGESCALYIAQRLGFPPHMLERASCAARRVDVGATVIAAIPPITGGSQCAKSTGPAPKIQKEEPTRRPAGPVSRFQLGDSVTVEGKLGLVYRPADEKGMVGVQIQGVKSLVNHKRVQLKTPAGELYPPDYDFSILFDSVENRKARRQMDKGYVPGLTITIQEPTMEKGQL